MVVGDHRVAERAVDAVDGVADHGGADVAYVHLLGGVRGRVVDHHRLACADLGNAAVRIRIERGKRVAEPFGGDCYVEEARTGDFDPVFRRKALHHLLRRLARISEASLLRDLQRFVALVVAELGIRRRHRLDLRKLNARKRLPETVLQPFCNSHFSSASKTSNNPSTQQSNNLTI